MIYKKAFLLCQKVRAEVKAWLLWQPHSTLSLCVTLFTYLFYFYFAYSPVQIQLQNESQKQKHWRLYRNYTSQIEENKKIWEAIYGIKCAKLA